MIQRGAGLGGMSLPVISVIFYVLGALLFLNLTDQVLPHSIVYAGLGLPGL